VALLTALGERFCQLLQHCIVRSGHQTYSQTGADCELAGERSQQSRTILCRHLTEGGLSLLQRGLLRHRTTNTRLPGINQLLNLLVRLVKVPTNQRLDGDGEGISSSIGNSLSTEPLNQCIDGFRHVVLNFHSAVSVTLRSLNRSHYLFLVSEQT